MNPEISVCICTYRRPADLRKTLRSLAALAPETPSFEIIVADNDAEKSGESSARSMRREGISITYLVEPVKNISRARNKAIASARADLIAFIDDDEIAEPHWLKRLHETLLDHEADAVFGPVLHRFEKPPPRWLLDLQFFDYPVPDTGNEMPQNLVRSGNVLLKKSSLQDLEHPFDETLGLSGGEDTDLFCRLMNAGAKLVAAREAIVYETVPAERMGMGWITRRYYRWGIGRVKRSIRDQDSVIKRIWYFLMATTRFFPRLIAAGLWYPIARGRSAKNFLRAAYWFGVCVGFFGVRFYEYK